MTGAVDSDQDGPVAALRRWEAFGGRWRVLGRDAAGITVSMRRCDTDEEADRLTSADPALESYLAGRSSSDD